MLSGPNAGHRGVCTEWGLVDGDRRSVEGKERGSCIPMQSEAGDLGSEGPKYAWEGSVQTPWSLVLGLALWGNSCTDAQVENTSRRTWKIFSFRAFIRARVDVASSVYCTSNIWDAIERVV